MFFLCIETITFPRLKETKYQSYRKTTIEELNMNRMTWEGKVEKRIIEKGEMEKEGEIENKVNRRGREENKS